MPRRALERLLSRRLKDIRRRMENPLRETANKERKIRQRIAKLG